MDNIFIFKLRIANKDNLRILPNWFIFLQTEFVNSAKMTIVNPRASGLATSTVDEVDK